MDENDEQIRKFCLFTPFNEWNADVRRLVVGFLILAGTLAVGFGIHELVTTYKTVAVVLFLVFIVLALSYAIGAVFEELS